MEAPGVGRAANGWQVNEPVPHPRRYAEVRRAVYRFTELAMHVPQSLIEVQDDRRFPMSVRLGWTARNLRAAANQAVRAAELVEKLEAQAEASEARQKALDVAEVVETDAVRKTA